MGRLGKADSHMEVLSSGVEPKECRAGWGGEFPEGRSLKEGEKQNETKHVGRRWFLRTYNPACHQTGKIRAVKRIMMAVDEGMHACMLGHISLVQLFATLWAVAHQTTLYTGFSRQEY